MQCIIYLCRLVYMHIYDAYLSLDISISMWMWVMPIPSWHYTVWISCAKEMIEDFSQPKSPKRKAAEAEYWSMGWVVDRCWYWMILVDMLSCGLWRFLGSRLDAKDPNKWSAMRLILKQHVAHHDFKQQSGSWSHWRLVTLTLTSWRSVGVCQQGFAIRHDLYIYVYVYIYIHAPSCIHPALQCLFAFLPFPSPLVQVENQTKRPAWRKSLPPGMTRPDMPGNSTECTVYLYEVKVLRSFDI